MKKLFVLEGEIKNKESKELLKTRIYVVAEDLDIAINIVETFAQNVVPCKNQYELGPDWA